MREEGRSVRVRKGDVMTEAEVREGQREVRRCYTAGFADERRGASQTL